MASFQRKRKLEDERNEIINRNLDKAIENGKMIREKDKKEAKRLKEMGEQLRKGLSKENIKEIFHDNLEYFKNIELGKEDSWRFAKFKDASKEQELLFRQIGELSKPEAEKNLDNAEGSYYSTGSTSSSNLFL